MKHTRMIVLLIVISLGLLPVYGCGKSKAVAGGSKVVARINNYEMTVNDFKEEAGRGMSASKEGLLEELIIKKVLLQEAQRQNFDKDKAFMKEIERYWEQALLKLLIKKKLREISQSLVIDENEVKSEYERKVKEGEIGMKSYDSAAPEIRKDIRHKKRKEAQNKRIADLRRK